MKNKLIGFAILIAGICIGNLVIAPAYEKFKEPKPPVEKAVSKSVVILDSSSGNNVTVTQSSGDTSIIVVEPDANDLCIVGKRYILYPPDYNDANPFNRAGAAHVTIVSKKKGYVKYCYTNELKRNPQYFSRSCEEFIDLTKIPN